MAPVRFYAIDRLSAAEILRRSAPLDDSKPRFSTLMTADDTIAALATAPSAAARAIIRVSGRQAFEIIARLASLTDDLAVGASTRVSIDLDLGGPIPATLYCFRAPRSSTGEDVIELHVPGSPFVIGRLLDRLNHLGTRQAEPGEFTARAFFHGKLGLSAAEGVAATIGAANRVELDAARSLLSGELARRLKPILDDLVGLLALVEADVDFADEDVSLLKPEQIRYRIDAISSATKKLLDEAPRIERLAHEPRVVLVGRPNAGKSTLLNAFAGQTRAVISPLAGTTRDALSARVELHSGTIALVDIAGIDELEEADESTIETQMSQIARDEIARADRVAYVRAADDERPAIEIGRSADVQIITKSDLPRRTKLAGIAVSAPRGEGMAELSQALDTIAFPRATGEAASSLAINGRHVAELTQSVAALHAARAEIGHGIEFIASELRMAVNHIGRVLGSVSPDDVLGRIFSSFCIGK